MIKLETTGCVSVLRLVLAARWCEDEDVSRSLCVYDAGDGEYAIGWHTLGGKCELTAASMLLSVVPASGESDSETFGRAVARMTNPTSDEVAKRQSWRYLIEAKGRTPPVHVAVDSVVTTGAYYTHVIDTTAS